MKRLRRTKEKGEDQLNNNTLPNNTREKVKNNILFTPSLDENISMIKSILADSDDVVFRDIIIPTLPAISCRIIYIKPLVNQNILETSVLSPLMFYVGEKSLEERGYYHTSIKALVEEILTTSTIESIYDVNLAIDELLAGNGLLFFNDFSAAISVGIGKGAVREHADPQTEKVVKGPQQGFVEDLDSNIAMVRKGIKSPNLVVKQLSIGEVTRSNVAVIYINNIADDSIINELFERLNTVKTDGLLSTGMLDEYITDNPRTLLQTSYHTERPDRAQAVLLEGRIMVFVEGTPFSLVIPSIFSDFFIVTEDYYANFYFATFNRFIRYFSSLVVVFLPSLYVAITTFHHEMLPTRLALTLAGARAGVPYPAFVEALAMEITFEALREAGSRLPTYIGQAVSIVGALIIGQAAVEAGLVSPAVVIVVATTAIFSFTIPYTNFSLGLRLVRFFNITLAAILGIYGIMTGMLFIGLTLVSLRSFGVPFMLPFAPISLGEMKDWVIRLPQWLITKRSRHFSKNRIKKSDRLTPMPPEN